MFPAARRADCHVNLSRESCTVERRPPLGLRGERGRASFRTAERGPRSALTGGRGVWRSTCGKGGESRSVVIGKGRHSPEHRRSRSQREYEACHSESFGGRGTRQMILTDGGQQPGSRSGTRKDTEAGAAATKKKKTLQRSESYILTFFPPRGNQGPRHKVLCPNFHNKLVTRTGQEPRAPGSTVLGPFSQSLPGHAAGRNSVLRDVKCFTAFSHQIPQYRRPPNDGWSI